MDPASIAAIAQIMAAVTGQTVGAVVDYYKNNPKELRLAKKYIKDSGEARRLNDLQDMLRAKSRKDYLQDKKDKGVKLRLGERRSLKADNKSLDKYYKQFPELKKNFNEGFKQLFDKNSGQFKDFTSQVHQDPRLQAIAQQKAGGAGVDGQGTGNQPYNRFSPEQITAQNENLVRAGKTLSEAPASFDPIAREAQLEFSRSIPDLMARFGNDKGVRSGAFAAALGSGAADFNTKLASERAKFDRDYRELALKEQASGLEPRFGAPIAGYGNQGGGTSNAGDIVRNVFNPQLWGEAAEGIAKGRQAKTDKANVNNIAPNQVPNIPSNQAMYAAMQPSQFNPYPDFNPQQGFQQPNAMQRYQAGMTPTAYDAARATYPYTY